MSHPVTTGADVLVTGGAGYIGSTVVSALSDAGHRPVVLDDLSAGRRAFLRGRAAYVGDIADRALLRRVLRENPGVRTVVHCAARVVVPESVREPAAYYRTNVAGTFELAETLLACGVTRLVFSGSAAIYAPGPDLGVDESSPWDPRSPYARTKAVAETLLADLAAATSLRVLSLRYFNPVGADPWLRTGPYQPDPSHVLGRLLTAHRTGRPFPLTGVDYPTVDGTGVRDYVHVWDLARAHVAALRHFDRALGDARHAAVDLGTGSGTTVRQLITTFEQVTGRQLPVVEAPRRAGDTVGAFTRSTRARRLLGWRPERTLADGIEDARAWSRGRHPDREAS
ncbi:UDP-glucose 4-epimerase GalE [Nocardioides carbamazepini]|uniref:UDP-glucose 4-epimerase GalE n=1 Tax=Nocardioides carbamazepini TaxID=2854259 RepID=UPI0021499F74|nr:UDP-glucose 4-epimerase GalE [Nocardioides carbamazepini]MCR1781999.1 UDP-glucose 4-epimerase GalE [Nocardioides carbamazepini]